MQELFFRLSYPMEISMSKSSSANSLAESQDHSLSHPFHWKRETCLNTILETSPIGILEVDRDGVTVACSRSFEDIAGRSREEMIGRFPFSGWMEESWEEGEALRRILHLGGTHKSAGRSCAKKADGSLRYVDLRIEEIRGNGDITGALIFVMEAADAAKPREKTRKVLIRVDEVQHMEMLNRVMDQSAHDFNNMLAPLRSYPDLIRLNYQDKDKVFRYLHTMETAAEKIAERNRDLLILGRNGRYKRTLIGINAAIEGVLQEKPFPETLAVHKDLFPDLLPVHGGQEELERLILHLVKNARETMNDRGVLTIRTENYYLDQSARKYRTVEEGEYVKITVGDTGPGIQEDILHRMNESSAAAGNGNGGNASGLGLKVVYSVVTGHRGCIDVEIRPGKGTSFFIYLPITREATLGNLSRTPAKNGEKILVIDDDPRQLDLLRRVLSSLGYRVAAAQNGRDAVTVYQRSQSGDQRFDLVVMDMLLRDGLDEVATYRTISEICPDQKWILLSGFTPLEKIEELQRLGAGPYLKKPVDLSLLSHVIRAELDSAARWILH